jgi:CDP-diglyceride synthetase
MGCLIGLLAVASPRLALLLVWVFTPWVSRAFDTLLVPLIGFVVAPFTTLIYVLVWRPGIGVTGWGWFWVVLAVLVDTGAYGVGGYASRRPARG